MPYTHDFSFCADVDRRYLPERGEGDTKATQVVTALTKLVYTWENNGDCYDTSCGIGDWNDVSSYANWLRAHTDEEAARILERVWHIEWRDEDAYEQILYDLCRHLEDPDVIAAYDGVPAVGTIYDCAGPFHYDENDLPEELFAGW